ncbi:hypothetical protein K2P97_06205 [bacterium]|nr:hypothetical protein [bacterium]
MKWISSTTIVLSLILVVSSDAIAKTTKIRPIQEVNFSEMNLKGTIRNPDGAYLVQKKGLKFLPLYNIQKDVDQKIREAALFAD